MAGCRNSERIQEYGQGAGIERGYRNMAGCKNRERIQEYGQGAGIGRGYRNMGRVQE